MAVVGGSQWAAVWIGGAVGGCLARGPGRWIEGTEGGRGAPDGGFLKRVSFGDESKR